MRYKALLLDVDGTLIPYNYDSLPSDKVAEAVKKAKEKVSVFVVTGRALNGILPILDKLGLKTGLIVTNGGALVFDLATKEIKYDAPIQRKESEELVSILLSENVEFWVKGDLFEAASHNPPFKRGDSLEKIYMLYADEVHDHDKVVRIFDKLSNIPNLALHKTKHADPTKYGFNITHAEATKLHGVAILLERAGLKREEIIGVGDGYNDFPLLMASGLKIAMGNAIPELKEVADYIAPSVDDDGVAYVIEKFILNKESQT